VSVRRASPKIDATFQEKGAVWGLASTIRSLLSRTTEQRRSRGQLAPLLLEERASRSRGDARAGDEQRACRGAVGSRLLQWQSERAAKLITRACSRNQPALSGGRHGTWGTAPLEDKRRWQRPTTYDGPRKAGRRSVCPPRLIPTRHPRDRRSAPGETRPEPRRPRRRHAARSRTTAPCRPSARGGAARGHG